MNPAVLRAAIRYGGAFLLGAGWSMLVDRLLPEPADQFGGQPAAGQDHEHSDHQHRTPEVHVEEVSD